MWRSFYPLFLKAKLFYEMGLSVHMVTPYIFNFYFLTSKLKLIIYLLVKQLYSINKTRKKYVYIFSIINSGMLELSYRFSTGRNDSFNSKERLRMRGNSNYLQFQQTNWVAYTGGFLRWSLFEIESRNTTEIFI